MTASLRDARVGGERQVELDIGRGIAVLLMICVHVQEVLSHTAVQYSLFGCIVEFVTGFPAAPLFMFVMGVGTVYSRRQDAGYAMGRGASLLLMAYLLSAARAYIPWSLGIKLGLLAQDAVPYGDVLAGLLEVDILHFAGLASSLSACSGQPRFLGGLTRVGLVLGGLNYWCADRTGQSIFDAILGCFGARRDVILPFLSWVMYPMVGVASGTSQRTHDKRRLYCRACSPVASCLLAPCASRASGSCTTWGFRRTCLRRLHEDCRNAVNVHWRLSGFLSYTSRAELSRCCSSETAVLEPGTDPNLRDTLGVDWWLALVVGFGKLMFWQTILACL